MLIKCKIKELDEWLFIEEVPDKYVPEKPLTENVLNIRKDPIDMDVFQLSTSGLFILHTNMHFDKPVHIHTEIQGEAITSQFISYKPADSKMPFGMSRHNIRYIPAVSSTHEVKTGIQYSYFIAVISKEYYLNLIKRDSVLHRDFVKKIEKGEYTSLSDQDFVASYEMQQTIKELIESRKTGEIRRLHTESRIVELLMYQLEQYNEQHETAKVVFTDDEIARLEMAREILEKSVGNPPTQKELAQQVMMSESKLRKDFKDYFSITIHDYMMRLRMEHARILLLEEKRSVYEVAILTGYGHQNNFSSAFKKYFGVSPGDIKV